MKRLVTLLILIISIYNTYSHELLLDRTFETGNGFNFAPNCVKIQPDGKILLGGTFTAYNYVQRNSLIRIDSSGIIDNGFTIGVGIIGSVESIDVQSDSKIIIGGSFTTYNSVTAMRIVRIGANGLMDPSFATGTGFNGIVKKVLIQPDGKILVAGEFTTYQGVAASKIVRLNSDGSRDNTFATGTGFGPTNLNTKIYTMALQSDGKIIVGGYFSNYQLISAVNIIRLNTDGSIDNTFTTSPGPDNAVYNIEIQSATSKILIAGSFANCGGASRKGVARLNSTGSLDNMFSPGTGVGTGFVKTVRYRSNGNIVIGGNFTQYNGNVKNNMCVLNDDGSVNTDIYIGSAFDSEVNAIEFQVNGKYIVAGSFSYYNGNTTISNRLIRLTLSPIFTGEVPIIICRGNSISVPYRVSDNYGAGNVFTAQLSDEYGNFVSPVNIGSVNSISSGTISAIIPANTTPGANYRIRVISSNPAEYGSDNGINIAIYAYPVVSITGDNSACYNSTSIYSTVPESNVIYTWTVVGGTTVGAANGSSVSVKWTGSPTGSLKLTAGNTISGCTSEANKTVTILDLPTGAIAGDDKPCDGTVNDYSTTLNSNFDYEWTLTGGTVQGAANTNTVKVIWTAGATGKIDLKITNKNTGCFITLTKPITINITPNPSISGPTAICEGDTVKLIAGTTSGYANNWVVTGGSVLGVSNDAVVTIISVKNSNIMATLTQTNAATGCKNTISKAVTVCAYPQGKIEGKNEICFNTMEKYTATGASSVTYDWSVTGGVLLSANDSPTVNINWIGASSGKIKLVLTNTLAGCKTTIEKLVSIKPEIKLTVNSGLILCQDSLGVLIGSATGGSGSFTYSWEPTTGLTTPTKPTTNVKIHDPGFYEYKLTVKDALGCTAVISIGVTVQSAGVLSVVSNKLDFGKLDGCTSNAELELTLKNETNNTIAVNSADFSDQEFSLVGLSTPFPIGAGASVNLPIKFAPTKTGISTCDLTLVSGSCAPPVKIKLTGEKLQMLISAKPTTFGLGKKLLCESTPLDTVITITNSGTDNAVFDLNAANIAAPYSIVAPKGVQTINPGKNLSVTIRYNPTAAATFNSNVLLPYSAGTCKDAVKLSFSAVTTEPVLKCGVSSIDFGAILGCVTYKDTTINVTNSGSADAQINTILGSDITILTALPIILKSGEQKSIAVRYSPVAQGNLISKITLSASPCDRVIEIPISANKQGVSYSIPDTVDCGSLIFCENQTTSVSFQITNNTPTSDCEIFSASVSGDFTSDIKTGSKIAIGKNSTFKATFTPNQTTPDGAALGFIDLVIQPCDIAKRIVLKGKKSDVKLSLDRTTIDFGSITENLSKTEIIKLYNTGSASVQINSNDLSVKPPFTIESTSPALPKMLNPGDTLAIAVKYVAQAGAIEQNLAINILSPCPVNFLVNVKGFGVVLVARLSATTKDFGEIYVSDTKTDSILVENYGDLDAIISDVNCTNPEFVVKSGQIPYKLKIGEKKYFNIDFTPASVGLKTANVNIISDIKSIQTTVSGAGKERPVKIVSAELALGDFRKKTGEVFAIPITITKSQNIDLTKTSGFAVTIKYNKTIMAPVLYSQDMTEIKDYQFVTLKGDLKDTLGKLGEYEFIAALGNDSCTTIQIDTVRWIGANIPTVTIPGSLCITDICRTCGDRFVDPTKKLAFNQVKLEQVGESIIVNFEVNEKAPTQIKLFNILGEIIYSQEFTPLDYENNSHKININSLSSGVYFISISNDERRITKAVSVGK